MWQTIIVLIILALAVIFLICRIRGLLRNASQPGCGCGDCSGVTKLEASSSCAEQEPGKEAALAKGHESVPPCDKQGGHSCSVRED